MTNTDVMQDIREHQPAVFRALFPNTNVKGSEYVTLEKYKKALLAGKINICNVMKSAMSCSYSEATLIAHALNVCDYAPVAEQISGDPYRAINYLDSVQTDILCKLLTSRHDR